MMAAIYILPRSLEPRGWKRDEMLWYIRFSRLDWGGELLFLWKEITKYMHSFAVRQMHYYCSFSENATHYARLDITAFDIYRQRLLLTPAAGVATAIAAAREEISSTFCAKIFFSAATFKDLEVYYHNFHFRCDDNAMPALLSYGAAI